MLPFFIVSQVKRTSLYCMVLALMLNLSGCGWLQHKSKPIVNIHPKYYVTFTGNIQPHMPYPMTIMFKATYAAYHPNCGVWISRFEGVKGMPGHPVYYPAHPNVKGDYKISIPIDAYRPRKCDWKITGVMYAFVAKIPPKKDWATTPLWGGVISFGNKKNEEELPAYPIVNKATSYCDNKRPDQCTGEVIEGGYVDTVPRNKSYHFIQNIRRA